MLQVGVLVNNNIMVYYSSYLFGGSGNLQLHGLHLSPCRLQNSSPECEWCVMRDDWSMTDRVVWCCPHIIRKNIIFLKRRTYVRLSDRKKHFFSSEGRTMIHHTILLFSSVSDDGWRQVASCHSKIAEETGSAEYHTKYYLCCMFVDRCCLWWVLRAGLSTVINSSNQPRKSCWRNPKAIRFAIKIAITKHDHDLHVSIDRLLTYNRCFLNK